MLFSYRPTLPSVSLPSLHSKPWSKAGQVMRTIGKDNIVNSTFTVFSTAVSRVSGYIAALDNHVYVLKKDGPYYFIS